MSVYINTLTLEYPRHIGDIQLEHPEVTEKNIPQKWKLVVPIDAPSYNYETQTAYELSPIQQNGMWYMQWAVRDLTQNELDEIVARNLRRAGFSQSFNNVPGSVPNVIG